VKKYSSDNVKFNFKWVGEAWIWTGNTVDPDPLFGKRMHTDPVGEFIDP
jgi:hypothetical protein